MNAPAIRLALLFACCAPAVAQWTHLAGDAGRCASAARGPAAFTWPRWVAGLEAGEQFVWQSTPVVGDGRVVVMTRVYASQQHVGNRLVAFDVTAGGRAWECDLPPDVNSSWSSPAIDLANRQVLVAVRRHVYAVNLGDGAVAWSRELRRNVTNASVAVSSGQRCGDDPANRALITDYDPFGVNGRLYALNVDASAPGNPHARGAIVWEARLGQAGGASPALRDGKVYVAADRASVFAFDLLDPLPDPNHPGAVRPDWRTRVAFPGVSEIGGFFGGITATGDALHAVTYEFFGGENNAFLVSLGRADGGLRALAAAERSDAIPVDWAGGAVLSGGIIGFGSRVKTQYFADLVTGGQLNWETPAAAGSRPAMGGWTHQPARVGPRLYVGSPDPNAPPGEFFGPNTTLHIVDLTRTPADPGFVLDSAAGPGGSPALAYGRLFSIGRDGLFAYDPSPACRADISPDGRVDLDDLLVLLGAFDASAGEPGFDWNHDSDLDGTIGLDDLLTLLSAFGGTCPS